ncbi:MAG: trypsin-like serine protease [Labilithrix sp.]
MRRTPLMLLALSGCFQAATDEHDAAQSSIVGGTIDEAHPSVVGVGGHTGPFCTGTVIARRAVLTAGHCRPYMTKRVFFGARVDERSPSIEVVRATRDPLYDEVRIASGVIGGVTHDLMILELKEDAPVEPSPLFEDTLDNSERFIGPKLVFVGYGSSGAGDFGTKRKVELSFTRVGPAPVGGTPGTIDETMIYYGPAGVSACNGDSGGPAFLVEDGREYLVATTSFGKPGCRGDGVYSRADAPAIARFIRPELDRIAGAVY